jgi:heme exporter protein D
MLMDLGPHAGFILASYAAMTFIVGGLIAWFALDGWRQERALRDLEARGVTRRSARRS